MFIDDNSICRLLRDRDSRGLELLFKYYYRPLVLWADTFLNDIPASEDLVQEFFVSFWEKHSYERITSGNLRGYLFVSVRNQSLKFLEKRDPLREAVHVPVFTSEEYGSLVEEYELGDLTEEMLQAVETEIQRLPPRMREVLTSVYIDGLSYRETSEKLNISISTVKTLLVNALKRLREIFSNFFSTFC